MPRLAAIFLVVVLVAACAALEETPRKGPGESPVKPTLTHDEAVAQVDRIARETADALDPKPTLDLYRPSLNTRYCNPDRNSPSDPIIVYRAYYLRGVPKDRLTDVAAQVRRFWEQRGFVIISASADGRNFTARSPADGFRVSLAETGEGVLAMQIGSPCALPDGAPTPHGET